LLFLMIGLLGGALLIATSVLRAREFQNMLLNETIMHLQNEVSTYHLRLEEYVSGDYEFNENDNENIWKRIESARDAVDLMIDGGYVIGGRKLKPMESSVFREEIEVIDTMIVQLEAMGRTRVAEAVHPGQDHSDHIEHSVPEREFDKVYRRIMIRSEIVEHMFHDQIAINHSRTATVFMGIIVIWFSISVFAAAGLNVLEGRRKKMEEDLLKSETRYRMVHTTSFDGILVADASKIIEANPATERIFGYGVGEMRGLSIEDLMPPKYHHDHRNGVKRFLETGEARIQGRIVEVEGVKKNGEEFPLELSINHFETDGQSYFTSTLRDITERKKAESDKEMLIDELQDALKKIKTLKGLIPICSYCKKIRDDTGYWNKVETYLQQHSEAEFTHGICEPCAEKLKEEGLALLREVDNGKKPPVGDVG
ncbi:MAG: PAS domain S-box protein, partial [Thermodesulfobacteriota bacterium]